MPRDLQPLPSDRGWSVDYTASRVFPPWHWVARYDDDVRTGDENTLREAEAAAEAAFAEMQRDR